MARKPIDQTRPEEKRQAAWEALRTTPESITLNAVYYQTRLSKHSLRDYLIGLERAGYLERIEAGGPRTEAKWRLAHDAGRHAPRVTKNGEPVSMGQGRLQMWRAMRVLGRFTAQDLAIHASTEEHQVATNEAVTYCRFLWRAGYLTQQGQHYQFVRRRYSGPKPPMIQRVKQVYDPNLEQVVWSQGGRHDAD